MNRIKFMGQEVAAFCFRFRSVLMGGVYFLIGFGTTLAAALPGIEVTDVSTVRTLVICSVAYWMFWILMSLSVVFVFVAAYKYLTSGGDAEKVGSATKTITYAAVAIVVALLAKGFPSIVQSVFPMSVGAGAGGCP
jgi:hypothetical protein